jgi:putative oxidoreductase
MSMVGTLSHLSLASIFISGGANLFINPEGPSGRVEAVGIPQARRATILNGAVMVVAGTMLAVGIVPKLAALVLAGTLVPTTLVGHPYWKETDSRLRASQQTQFLKNLAVVGGLLAVLAEKGK